MKTPNDSITRCLTALALGLICASRALAAPTDLTAPGVIAGIDRTNTYNLGATGLRGWIWVDRDNKGDSGLITDPSRQILVTHCVAPANAVLAVDDLILGAMAASSGTVPDFSSDCRKAFAAAITDAEKTAAGTLRVKRWRAGIVTDQNISLPILGNYSATAPFGCPKSTIILDNVRNKMVADLLANPNYLSGGFGGSSNALALLSGVKPGDPNYNEVQTRLQSFARSLASAGPLNDSIPMWSWSYSLIYLAEYYLITGDAQVVPGIQVFTLKMAQSQSIYGTYGHGPSALRTDGSGRLVSTGYGPVNAVGGTAAIALVMGKKALVAAGQAIAPEIDAAIQRSSSFFAFYINKGAIPYGEHEPVITSHASNGKDAMPAVFFALQAGRAAETEYFSRISIAGWIGREYGHTGQGLSYYWATLGALMGGPDAASEHLKQVRWHLDLSRRTDGSFAYDGQEQYGPGTTSGNTYLGAADYGGMSANAMYLLTYSLPLQRLCITGKGANPAYTLNSTKIAAAVSAGSFRLDRGTKSISELFTAIGDYDPIVRNFASIELASRTLSGTDLTNLRSLLASTDPNSRQGACQTLGLRQDSIALPTIVTLLNDTDVWVRAKAAIAIRAYPSATASTHRDSMMTSFIANATDPNIIDWNDPIQMGNGKLSLAIFGNAVGDGTPGNDIASYTINAPKQTLLYPALRVGLQQPDSYPRLGVTRFCRERLPLADVQAIYPNVAEVAAYDTMADRMWSNANRNEAIRLMADLKISEGIPLALSMLEVPYDFAWGSPHYMVEALNAIASYGDAARYTLPTLRAYLTQWSPTSEEYPALVTTINTLENAITSPAQSPGLCVANSQVVTTTGAKAITLSGASPRGAFSYLNVTQPANGTVTGTAPNLTYTPNGGYTGPDKFTFQTTDTLTTSTVATVGIVVGPSGNGVKGDYFNNMDFTSPVLNRTDSQINFDWGTGSPHASVGTDTFSARWSGALLVPQSGSYTFSSLSSDGVRLYVNGRLVIDRFADQSTRWTDGTPIQLTAGQYADIHLEYYENTGSAAAKLKWIGPSFAGPNGDFIPQTHLFDGSGMSNQPVYAFSQNLSTSRDTPLPIALNGSGGTLTYGMLTQPLNGTLSGTAPYLTYTPNTSFSGNDSFTYLVNNGTKNSLPATISINVQSGSLSSFTWASAVSGDWNTAARWTPVLPAAAGLPSYALNFNSTGSYTATHNLNNAFQLNQLNTAANVTISGTQSMSFVANGGSLPTLNHTSGDTVTIHAPLALQSTTTLAGLEGGRVVLTGVISGNGGIVKNTQGILQIDQTTNTYSGGTMINAGRVVMPGGDGSPTPSLGSGTITINPGAVLDVNRNDLSNSMVLNGGTITGGNGFPTILKGPITLNGISNFDFEGGGFEIHGNMSGPGGFTYIGPFNPWTTFPCSGTNTYTGPTTILKGTLSYPSVNSVPPGSLILNAESMVKLSYTGTRVIESLTLNGTIMPPGTYGSTASNATNKNDTYFADNGTLTVPQPSTTALVLTSGSTPANPGASLTFTATVTGSAPTGNVQFFSGTTLLGTAALNGSFQASLGTTQLAIGSNSITARYIGSATNSPSTSSPIVAEINNSPVAAPTGLIVSPGTLFNSLNWTASPAATGYYVQRSTTLGGPYTVIALVTGNSYQDNSIVSGVTYHYAVSAINAAGESSSLYQTPTNTGVNVLVIGSTRSFSEGNESGVVQEKAFNPAGVATHLQGILSQDPAFTGSVNVEFEDIYKTKAQTVNTSGATTDNLTSHCYSLAQHYLWPDGKAARLANLRGEGARVWDYIVLCNDPYITANFPGMVAEGVKLIQSEVAKSANPAQVVLLGQWPEDSSTFTASQFNEIAYRVGNSAGITVVPAGKAWSSYGSKDTSSNHPTPRGEYLAAASIYSKLFNRNANTSSYTYPTVGSAIASHALSVVQANNGVSQYSGSYTSFNPFQMKYLTKRVVSYRETGTSTEDRLAQALDRLDDVQRITLSTTGYAGVPGTRWDFNYGRGGDVWEDDKDYEVNPAIYDWVYGFPMHHYTIATAPITMPYGIDKHFIDGTAYEDGTDLGIPYNMIRPNTREPDWPEAVRAIPIRLMWQKMAENSPGFHPLGDSTHMHPNLNDASAAFMYTLISGRCPIVDEPTPQLATNPAWMQWLGHKTGYETAWQMSHLTTRSPGFKVLPASVSATSVTPTTNTFMTVQFMNPPQSDVTVNVTISNANAAIVGSKQLVFTPQNHRAPQSVVVSGLQGSAASEAFNVVFTTVSTDEVFNDLTDSWAYQTTRSAPATLTRVEKGTSQFTANQNLPVTINLNTAGAISTNTILAGPSRGTIAWSGSNVIYTPGNDFLGQDGFSFAVNNAGTLSVGYIEITVTGAVPNGMVSYRGNGSNGGAVPIDSNTYAQNATVTVPGNTGNLTRVGHNFTGWNTAANGSGTSYNAGSTFNIGASGMILHAQWTSVPTYTVSYNGNTNNGGFIPSNQIKTDGVNLTLATNSGALTKTGHTFAGWNTATNGTGEDYAAGGTYGGNANLTLHSKWTPNNYTVTFSANGGDTPSPTSKSVTYNTPYGTLATISRSGHTFNGWFTATTGGTQILSTTNVTITGNQTLHAQWTASTSYTVSYDANGADSGTVPANQSKIQDVPLTLATNSGGLTRAGFTFAGWNTSANGSGTAYPAGASYIANASVTLFAQWAGVTTYTVSYDGNGNTGGGVPSNQTKTQGISLTLATNSANLTRVGFGFAGWNTAANGSGIAYAPEAVYTADSASTLYAQWNAVPVVNAGTAQTVTLNGAPWSPALLAPQLWLDADDATTITLNGATVSEWRDKSGNTRHAAQTAAASQPTRTEAALNGKPVLTFDGTADFLNLGTGLDFLAGVSHSAFIVTKPTSFSNIYGAANGSTGANSLHVGFNGTTYRMNFWANDYNPARTANFVSGSANIVNYIWAAGASKQILANGKSEGISTSPLAGTIGTMSGGGRIGNVAGLGFIGGDIAEMVFFTGTVSAADRESMEGYLAHKWGMTANLAGAHPYKTAAPGGAGAVATLDGTATDADPLTYSWSVVSGPSTVSFTNAAAINSGATFAVAGMYTLRLTANDGFSSVSSDIVVTVNAPGAGNSVNYSGNGSTGGSIPVDASSPYANGTTVTVLGNTGALVRTGYTFNNWNTAADGSGTSYVPAATFSINSNTTLHAQWTINPYTITFDSAGGSTVTAITQNFGTSVAAPANPIRSGYTFAGWSPALPSTMPANNQTVTAQWTINPYTITFDSAGGSPVTAISQNFGTSVTAPANPTRSGHTFAGWSPLLPSTMPANDQTVTAQWTANSYTVTFDANGGSAPNPTSKSVTHSSSYGSLAITSRAGYTFNGWFTAVSGGTQVISGTTVAITAGQTLYAQWTPDTFAVTYDGNGNTSGTAPSSQTKTQDVNLTLAANTGNLSRIGFAFSGWNTSSNGTGTPYSAGATYLANASVTLFAQWTLGGTDSTLADSYLTSLNVSSPTSLFASLNFPSFLDGPLTGLSTLTHTGFVGSQLSLVNNTGNTFEGNINVNGGILRIAGNPFATTAGGFIAPSMTSSDTITINRAGILAIDDNVAGGYTANRFGSAGNRPAVNLAGGTLNLSGLNNASSSAQTLGTLTSSSGYSIVNITRNSNGSPTMNFGSLAVSPGSVINLFSAALGTGTNDARIIFTSAPAMSYGIMPGVKCWSPGAAGQGEFATYGASGVTPFTAYDVFAANDINGATSTQNVRMTGAFTPVALTADRSVNSLNFNGNGGTWSLGGNKLTIGSGMFLRNGTNMAVTINNGTLTAGNGFDDIDLHIFTAQQNVSIDAVIADNSASAVTLVKSHGNTLTVSGGANNTYTGGTYVVDGVLSTGNVANRTYLGSGKVTVDGTSELNLGAIGATSNASGDDFTVINGGRINLSNGNHGTVDTFNVGTGSVIAGGSGTNSGLASLSRGTNVTLAEDAVIGHQTPLAAALNSTTHTIRDLGTNADLYFGISSFNQVSASAAITIGNGTAFKGLAAYVPSTFDGGTINVASGTSDVYIKTNISPAAAPNTLTLGDNFFAGAPVIALSDAGTVNVNVLGNLRFNDSAGTYGNAAAGRNVRFVSTAGSTITVTQAAGMGSTSIASALVRDGGSLAIGNASALNGEVTVEAGGRLLASQAAGLTGTGALTFDAGSILEITNSTGFSGAQATAASIAAGTIVRVNNGAQPGTATVALDSILGSKSPIYQLSGDVDVPEPSSLTTTMTLNKNGSGVGGIVTNGSASAFFRNNVNGRVAIGANGGVIAATSNTELQVQENIEGTNVTLTFGTTAIIDGLPKLGSVALGSAAGSNNYTGENIISAGIVRQGYANVLGALTNQLTVNGGRLNMNAQALTVGNLTGTGGIINGGGTLTIGQGDNGGGNFQGSIQANNALIKTGAGTITLSGNNTYTGTTAINAGTLLINGNQSSASGNVTVVANATLGGTGTLGGSTTIAAGGRLEFNLSTPAASHNPLDISSGRSFAFSGASTLVINATSGATPGIYTLITGGNNITGVAPATLSLPVGWAATVSISGNSLLLNVTSTASDTTAPALVSITDDQGGSSIVTNTTVNYTVTFSEDIDAPTVTPADFGNAGTASGIINSVTETSPGVFLVSVTASSAGSLRLGINAGAVLSDNAGNALNTSTVVLDDTTITVTPLNSAPVAVSQNVTTNEDTASPVTLTATDANNDPLGYSVLSVPANGTLSGTVPNLTYTPAANFNGTDSFTFGANDGLANSNVATVSITVTAVNDAPVAIAQSVAPTEDITMPITLTGSDVENSALTFAIVTPPANGTLSGGAPNVTYTPSANYDGADSFTFRVNDGTVNSVIATVSINVTPVNDAPVAVAQSVTTDEDTVLPITLAGTDVEGSALSYIIVTPPANGALSGTGSNLTFTPAANFNGSTSFTFAVNDGTVDSAAATVSITVTPVNDVPVFIANPIVTAGASESMAYTGQTLAERATDGDSGDTITYSKVGGPAWLVVASNGALSGTPPTGAAGLNSFVVRATDNASGSADATLEITVTGLPLPWISSDIGTGMLAGSATFNAGTFTQAGSGIIGSTSDKLRFTYQTLTGDGEIIAKISSLQNTGTSSRVGVVIRDSLAANSKQIFMGMSGTNAYRWMRRTTTGGSTTTTSSSTGTVPNTWVRLVRSGTTITAYKSTNGTSWTTVGSTTSTTFASTCYIGLAVSSGSVTTLNTSQFSNISVTP